MQAKWEVQIMQFLLLRFVLCRVLLLFVGGVCVRVLSVCIIMCVLCVRIVCVCVYCVECVCVYCVMCKYCMPYSQCKPTLVFSTTTFITD